MKLSVRGFKLSTPFFIKLTQMYLTSLNGLDDLVKSTKLYASKKGVYKKLLVDKVNLFVSTVIYQHRRKGVNMSEGVPLHSDIIKNLIGKNHYRDIVDLLIEIDIINKDDSYTTICVPDFSNKKPESKKYSITQKGLEMKICNVGVLTKNIKRKIQVFRDKNYKHLLKHPIHKKILFGLSDICPDLEACDEVLAQVRAEGNLDRIFTYETAYETLIRFCEIKTVPQLLRDPAFFYRVSTSGRVYHTISNLPSAYRKHLTTHSGEPLAELDMISAQPFLLTCEFIKELKNSPKTKKEQKKEAKDLFMTFMKPNPTKLNGFYYHLATISGMDTNFNDDKVYKEVKQGFITAMYKKNYYETNFSTVLSEHLPYFSEFIDQVKKYDYKNGAFLGQSAEADIFIDNYFSELNRSATSIPVHDSVLVPQGNIEEALIILYKGMTKRYDFMTVEHAKRVIKVDRPTLTQIDPFNDYG